MKIEDFDTNTWPQPNKNNRKDMANHPFVPVVTRRADGMHIISLNDGTVLSASLDGGTNWLTFLGFYAPLTHQAPVC